MANEKIITASNKYQHDYDVILINGDSYSAPNQRLSNKVYGHWLGELLDIPVKNIAWGGANNSRIIRSTIEEITQIKQQYKNPLVLIGWSFIQRIEVYYNGNNPGAMKHIPDRNGSTEELQPRLVTLDALIDQNEATLEQKCMVADRIITYKLLTDFYTNQFMLAHTLAAMDTQYFFFLAANDVDLASGNFPWINSLHQSRWCHENKNIYKLNNFSLFTFRNSESKFILQMLLPVY
jgi:hypothetical protein